MAGIQVTTGNPTTFVSQIESSIQGMTQQLGKYVTDRLQHLLKVRLAASGLKVQTGALQRSIVVNYKAYPTYVSIEVGCMIYGVFNSFGVGPQVKKGKIYDIPNWILNSLSSQPRGGKTFNYDPNVRTYGIKARKWLPDDQALQNIVDDFYDEYLKMNRLK